MREIQIFSLIMCIISIVYTVLEKLMLFKILDILERYSTVHLYNRIKNDKE